MKSFTLFSLIVLVTAIGCTSNKGSVVKTKPGQKPPVATNPSPTVPAPASAPIARDTSKEIIGNFQTNCFTGEYRVKNDNVTTVYQSYRVLLDMEATTITERVVWYIGASCNATYGTAEEAKYVWYYRIDKQGATSSAPWDITYSSIGMDFTNDNSATDQIFVTFEQDAENNLTVLRFDSEDDAYTRVQ